MAAHPTPPGPASHWRVLPTEVDAPSRLLEGSEHLLEDLRQDPTPTLRWYRSTDTAIVLGRGQRRLDLQAQPGVDVVHRASGGGAVLLTPGMLSLDVALPAEHPWLDQHDLGSVFLEVGTRWATALSSLGVAEPEVHRGPSTTPRASDARTALVAAVCFASLGRGEITVGGRKLVGLSQRRRRHGALIQCGLLRRWRPEALLAALDADARDPEITRAAIGLDDLLDDPPEDAAVIDAVTGALSPEPTTPPEGAAATGSPRPSPR